MKNIYPFTIALLVLVLFFNSCAGSSLGPTDAAISLDPSLEPMTAGSTDDFIVVDCMLPGQVRRLGKMVYQTPRRPLKTTASDCQIKGGEYVAYDRSDINTALATWMEKAEQGDKVAQTYVGEIYQNGINGPPRYDKAVKWFEKASQQNYSRAQFNLGYLYEQGLGVEKNSVKALNLYRQASGLTAGIVMEEELLKERKQVEALKKEVERRKKETKDLKRELDETRRQQEQAVRDYESVKNEIVLKEQKLEKTQAQLTSLMQYGREDEINELQDALAKTSSELKAQRLKAAELQKKAGRLSDEAKNYQTDLARYESQAAGLAKLKDELEQRRKETEDLRRELSAVQDEMVMIRQAYTREQWVMDQEKHRLEKARVEFDNLKTQTADANNQRLADLSKEISLRQEKLERQRAETRRLKEESEKLNQVAETYRTQIAAYKERASDMAGPKIQIIDPKLLATRSTPMAIAAPDSIRREITGKVTAPAGLFFLRVNEKKYQLDKNGLFSVDLPVNKNGDTNVNIVAVDTQGKSDTITFTIASEKKESLQTAGSKGLPKVNFGSYHALIIGNNAYENLPRLETAANDARKFDQILREKYGFHTKVLLNATRSQIYAALDDYRKNLTENDNFLIYYAGHGEMDKKNKRGYWLPIDADPDSYINSIPNYTITDILNIMSVKQAIVISDTCYSGIMTRSAIAGQQVGMSEEKRLKWLEQIATQRSRTVLTSGGLMPVLDAGVGDHSIFAKSLLDTLGENNRIIEAGRLYRKIRPKVINVSNRMGFKQVPQYAANLHAGHQSGDFLFVPAALQKG